MYPTPHYSAAALAVFGSIALAGCAKPCEPIPQSETTTRMGVVLEGGRMCKESRGTATVHYPGLETELSEKYQNELTAAGWQAKIASPGVVDATKGDDTVFVVTGKNGKLQKVPFAVISLCENSGCRERLSGMADAMGKYK